MHRGRVEKKKSAKQFRGRVAKSNALNYASPRRGGIRL